MKLSNLIKFIAKPKKYFRQAVQKEVERRFAKLDYQKINDFKEDDVFLVAFPKSGITWLQSIVAGLQYGIDTYFLPDKLTQMIVPDIYVSQYYKRFGDIKIFKSHELPNARYRRVIYLVRDGRDAMLSYYHFNKRLGKDFSLKEMIMKKKGVYPTSWAEHVRKWLENPYNSKIIYIKYEDMLAQPMKVAKKILNFINLERDEELIKKIIEGNNFTNMQKKAEKYGGLGHPDWKGDKGKFFFRQGKAGIFQKEMDPELIKFFEKEAKKELLHYNYETIY